MSCSWTASHLEGAFTKMTQRAEYRNSPSILPNIHRSRKHSVFYGKSNIERTVINGSLDCYEVKFKDGNEKNRKSTLHFNEVFLLFWLGAICSQNDLASCNWFEYIYTHKSSFLGKLEKYEIPRRAKICIEQWTPENELVTAAFKLKRKNISNFYKNDLRALYEA